MASFFAALMGAIPVAMIAAIVIPLFVIDMGIYAFPELINPETYKDLINEILTSPEWQPEALIETLKEMLQATLEMQ